MIVHTSQIINSCTHRHRQNQHIDSYIELKKKKNRYTNARIFLVFLHLTLKYFLFFIPSSFFFFFFGKFAFIIFFLFNCFFSRQVCTFLSLLSLIFFLLLLMSLSFSLLVPLTNYFFLKVIFISFLHFVYFS